MTLFLHACPKVLDKLNVIPSTTIWEGQDKPFSAPALLRRNECNIPLIIGNKQDFGWHQPYNEKLHNHSVVALFRHPTRRIISAFLFAPDGGSMPSGFARDRKNGLPVGWNREKEIRKFKSQVINSPHPIVTYADALHMRACQTKMVLGYSCAFNISLTDEELYEAKRRLIYDFAFIGLTEEYTASVQLFHKQFGVSDPRVLKYENIHLRKNTAHTKQRDLSLKIQLNNANFKDRFDDEIYKLASRIFYSRCVHYNITVKNKKFDQLYQIGAVQY
eukprot:gene4688-9291_t